MFSAKEYALKITNQMEADGLTALQVAQVVVILHNAVGETFKELSKKKRKK